MFSSKAEIAKRAVEIAKKKYPKGFNKKQLINCSKEVYGGFGVTQVSGFIGGPKSIKTMEDINNMGNAMAQIDGHYPVGMSGCYVVGLNGECGLDCPVYLNGDCEDTDEFAEYGFETNEQKILHRKLYG